MQDWCEEFTHLSNVNIYHLIFSFFSFTPPELSENKLHRRLPLIPEFFSVTFLETRCSLIQPQYN